MKAQVGPSARHGVPALALRAGPLRVQRRGDCPRRRPRRRVQHPRLLPARGRLQHPRLLAQRRWVQHPRVLERAVRQLQHPRLQRPRRVLHPRLPRARAVQHPRLLSPGRRLQHPRLLAERRRVQHPRLLERAARQLQHPRLQRPRAVHDSRLPACVPRASWPPALATALGAGEVLCVGAGMVAALGGRINAKGAKAPRRQADRNFLELRSWRLGRQRLRQRGESRLPITVSLLKARVAP
jgi:hypothetical protein